MQRLTIKKLGPISDCTIDVKDFMVFTGPQASGKSTIAKSIFLFNNLKNVLYLLISKDYSKGKLFQINSLAEQFEKKIKEAVVQAFGRDSFREGTLVEYVYDNGGIISVENKKLLPNVTELTVSISDDLINSINSLAATVKDNEKDISEIRDIIENVIFSNEYEIVYIPAGRSLLTMLSSQINYLYAVMDDQQKNMIDYCTRCYLEQVLRIKDFFSVSLLQLAKQTLDSSEYDANKDIIEKAVEFIKNIMHGEYRVVSGEERLFITETESVKLNYSSSGQQEVAWIVNMLFYYMLGKRKTFFIIEEPESHLFPETQKAVVELIALVKNGSNKALITTHSPYVLGTVNNLLYADCISDGENNGDIDGILSEDLWLKFDTLGAYYIENGEPKNIADSEYQDINHDVIDGVSGVLNEDYEKLMDVARKE
ncbi:MAG: ATP-binding protein [Lachnospiraceae bacterium]|nr:ATP-binding protein [Lachnospiraceae bacterium]